MMHSGQPLLLRQHWPQAVEFFITHLLAQDNMHRVSSLHDIRQYFANFCRTSVPSGRALQQYLMGMQGVEKQREEAEERVNDLWE